MRCRQISGCGRARRILPCRFRARLALRCRCRSLRCRERRTARLQRIFRYLQALLRGVVRSRRRLFDEELQDVVRQLIAHVEAARVVKPEPIPRRHTQWSAHCASHVRNEAYERSTGVQRAAARERACTRSHQSGPRKEGLPSTAMPCLSDSSFTFSASGIFFRKCCRDEATGSSVCQHAWQLRPPHTHAPRCRRAGSSRSRCSCSAAAC